MDAYVNGDCNRKLKPIPN